MFRNRLTALLEVLTLVVCCSGCGSDFEKPTAKVQGIVRLEGEPVTEGYVIFQPIPSSDADPLASGKTGSGTIQPDGSFEVTTYHDGDGAMVGSHIISFYKPDPVDDEQIVRDPYLPGGKEIKVEVQEEPNFFEIDLYRTGAPRVSHSPL